MKLHQEITEALDDPVPFKVLTSNDEWFEAEFEVNGRHILFQADPLESDANEKEVRSWEVVFKEPGAGSKAYELTRSGGEFQVFATIKKILEKMLKDRPDIQAVHFTADKSEQNRARLYTKLLKKFMPVGFKYNEDNKTSDYRVYFSISRK